MGQLLDTQHAPGPGSFEDDVRAVLHRLRNAFALLIEALPGTVSRPTDLERTLDIGTKLAWQVHRIAHAPNPLSESEHVPGAAGVRQLLKAAAKQNVDGQRIEAVNDAMASFDAMVRDHAGDRATFTTMAGTLIDGGQELVDLKLRKAAFRDNSRVWGVQVKVMLWASITSPGARSAKAEHVDSILLRGLHQVRRLRPDAPLRLSYSRVYTQQDPSVHQSMLGSVDDGSLTASPTVLEQFCTQPLPPFVTRTEGDYVATYLPPGPIGRNHGCSYYIASVSRDIPWRSAPDSDVLDLDSGMAVTKPCERYVVDTIVHEDMLGNVRTRAGVYGSLNKLGQPSTSVSEDEVLPVEIEPLMRGQALEAIHTPHVPRYREMFEHVCGRMGWDARRFVLFRWEFRFPVLGSFLYTQVRLPEYGTGVGP